jgi:hypothetical protein
MVTSNRELLPILKQPWKKYPLKQRWGCGFAASKEGMARLFAPFGRCREAAFPAPVRWIDR